jgi:hypothetical protein
MRSVWCAARAIHALMMLLQWMRGAAIAFAIVLCALPAHAYTYETAVTVGCHERISSAAFRGARAQAAWPVTRAPQELLMDLPFRIEPDLANAEGVALLFGVRDNDLHGEGPTDLGQIAAVHGNPATQHEHCLRAPNQDGFVGLGAALDATRKFVLSEVAWAQRGLDAAGHPDAQILESWPITLPVRGKVMVQVSVFYMHMGRALHAIQDAFTHTFRNTNHEIVAVATWVDTLRSGYDPSRDGPEHADELDRCERGGALRNVRETSARDASRDVLALSAGAGTIEERVARVAARLNSVLAVASEAETCTVANAFCGSPDYDAQVERHNCAIATRPPQAQPVASWISALAIVIWLGRAFGTRRRLRHDALQHLGTMALGLVLLMAHPGMAIAQPVPVPSAPLPQFSLPPLRPRAHRWALTVSAGASIDRGGLAQGLGARLRLTPSWDLGAQIERNPWYSVSPFRARAGALNIYATLVKRWTVHSSTYAIRSSAHLGTSTSLISLYGVPAGSTGILVGTSFLGLEMKLSPSVAVVMDPANVILVAPQLSGVPFAYLQYRFTVSVEIGL